MAISNLTHFAFGWGWAGAGLGLEEDLILTIFSRCRNSWLSRRHTQGQRAQLRCKYQRNIFTERNCAQHSRNKVPIPPHPSITHSILLCSRKSIPPLLMSVISCAAAQGISTEALWIYYRCVCVLYSVYSWERAFLVERENAREYYSENSVSKRKGKEFA